MQTNVAMLLFAALWLSCGNPAKQKTPEAVGNAQHAAAFGAEEKEARDSLRGIGKFTKVEVGPTLDKQLADAGQKVYDMKCMSCHKLTDERIVGPGWKDVTRRHTPEWIMNFSTNTDEMLNKDPKAMAMLEICLIRMPNQNLSDHDARAVLEFMRKNDGVK